VVTNFQDWRFEGLPDIWTRCASIQDAISNTAPQSNLTAAIRQRDVICRITAFESGTEVAHLIPEHERQWFLSNSMTVWNNDLTLDPDNLLRDLSNAVLLRSDMHTAFDQRKFVFFPKDSEGYVLYMLEPTSDIGQLYHNTRVNIPQCSPEFLFARFAWSLFPSLSGFLSRPAKSRLVVRLNADGERSVEEVTNPFVLGRKATASRSNSPTKRSRMTADLDEDIGYSSKRRRNYEAKGDESSFDSTLPTLEDDSDFEQKPSHTLNNSRSITHSKVSNHSDVYIDELRQDALARQRPAGYELKRPPYDRHRPAEEELELMGVEILGDLDGMYEEI
jgi:HNH endonuclease